MAEYTTSKPEWAPEQDDNNFACGVMSGIEGITDTTVGNLNPALKDGTMKPKRKMILSVDDYIKGVSAGDRVTLARAITLIESNNPHHFGKAQQVLRGLLSLGGGWEGKPRVQRGKGGCPCIKAVDALPLQCLRTQILEQKI